MTEALFLETVRTEEALREKQKRRLNVSGVLKILGVLRIGYTAWKKQIPSDRAVRKQNMKATKEMQRNYSIPVIIFSLFLFHPLQIEHNQPIPLADPSHKKALCNYPQCH